MSEYERVVDAKGVVRYKLDGRFVKGSEVPENVKTNLNDVVADTIDEVNEDGVVEVEAVSAPAAPQIDDADDVDDESGIDDEIVAPKANLQEEGMGFKRVNGKTVDIFDGKTPHDAVRFVGGLTVPVTKDNYTSKTDTEILEQLKKLGKI